MTVHPSVVDEHFYILADRLISTFNLERREQQAGVRSAIELARLLARAEASNGTLDQDVIEEILANLNNVLTTILPKAGSLTIAYQVMLVGRALGWRAWPT